MRCFIVLCLSICLLLGQASAQGQGNNLLFPLLLAGGDLGGDNLLRLSFARSLFGGGADPSGAAGAGGAGSPGSAGSAAGAGSQGSAGGCFGLPFWLCLSMFN